MWRGSLRAQTCELLRSGSHDMCPDKPLKKLNKTGKLKPHVWHISVSLWTSICRQQRAPRSCLSVPVYIRHVYVVVFSASPASRLVGGADQSEAATEREGEGRREGVATRPALNMAEQRLRSAVPLYLTCLYETKRHGE